MKEMTNGIVSKGRTTGQAGVLAVEANAEAKGSPSGRSAPRCEGASSGRSAAPQMTKRKTEEPRDLTLEDREHVKSLHEKFGSALSLEQIESNYRMSLGLPDANGRTPANREQLGAMKLFADLLVPRPKAEEQERERAQIVVGCMYCEMPCGCNREP